VYGVLLTSTKMSWVQSVRIHRTFIRLALNRYKFSSSNMS